jgi:hypothetical protein
MMPAKRFANPWQPTGAGLRIRLPRPRQRLAACHFYITYFMVHIQPIP